jgi:acyl-coenzyme A synthetase/AMP-(fatty) acid ligase
VIAGKVPDDFRRAYESELRATRFLGWVENSADELAECRIGAIAEPLGGGFKLKALDYVFNDVAVASLSHSAAGLPFAAGSSMIVADDESGLVDAIVEAIDEPAHLERVVLEARMIATDHFSWTAAARSLIDAVVGPTSKTA